MPDSAPRRAVGRPRTFSDEVIFQAVSTVLRRDGYPRLTLESVANEVGCTRQALVRRFGSKREMLLASLDAAELKITADFDQVRAAHDSPLSALHARFLLPPNSRPELGTDPGPQAHTMAYILTTSSDRAFGDRFARLSQIGLAEFRRLLDAAVVAGELRAVDTSALARTLQSVWAGETINWCADQTVAYATTQASLFEQIIGAYRVAGPAAVLDAG